MLSWEEKLSVYLEAVDIICHDTQNGKDTPHSHARVYLDTSSRTSSEQLLICVITYDPLHYRLSKHQGI